MNHVCPNCGWTLSRPNHPHIDQVRFCRASCIADWQYRHFKIMRNDHVDPLPSGGDRRSVA